VTWAKDNLAGGSGNNPASASENLSPRVPTALTRRQAGREIGKGRKFAGMQEE
jgi:hypothetical protein